MQPETITKRIQFLHVDNCSIYKIEHIKTATFEIPNRSQGEFYWELYRNILDFGEALINEKLKENKEFFKERYQLVAIDDDKSVYLFHTTSHNIVQYGAYAIFTKLAGSCFIKKDCQQPENAIAGRAWYKPAETIVSELNTIMKTHNSVVAVPTKPNKFPTSVNNVEFKIKKSKETILKGLEELKTYFETEGVCKNEWKSKYFLQILNNTEFFVEQCDWKKE